MFLYDDDYRVMFDIREDSLLEEEKLKRLVENLGERVEAWSADEWDEVDWGAEALDSMALESEALDPETEDTADLIIAVYSKHDGKLNERGCAKNDQCYSHCMFDIFNALPAGAGWNISSAFDPYDCERRHLR